jgi:hypothetical protein
MYTYKKYYTLEIWSQIIENIEILRSGTSLRGVTFLTGL